MATPWRLCGAVAVSPTPRHVDAVGHDSFHTCWRPPGIGDDGDHDDPPLDDRSANTRVPTPTATHDVADAHVIVHPSLNLNVWMRHDAPPLTVLSTE